MIVETIEIDQALIDECKSLGDVIDVLRPQLEALAERCEHVLGTMEVARIPLQADEDNERFMAETGLQKVSDFVFEVEQMFDHDGMLHRSGYVEAFKAFHGLA